MPKRSRQRRRYEVSELLRVCWQRGCWVQPDEESWPGGRPPMLFATSSWLALVLGSIQAIVLAAALPLYLPADKLRLLSASRWFMLYLPAAYVTPQPMGSDKGG